MSQAYPIRSRKASRILREIFDLEQTTSLGGLNPLARFAKGLGVDRKLFERFGATKAGWARWPLARVLRVMLDAHFAGIERLYHFEDLETEPLLCFHHGVDRLPDVTTLYRDLRRFEDPKLLAHLKGIVAEITLEALADQRRAVVEFDSTVQPLYGQQEGAAIGPNPVKPGRASYHPLLARERISDLILHHRLRPGNTNAAAGANSFVHETLDLLRADGRPREILVRMDAGFETDTILRTLERRGVGYVVKMRATADLAFHVASSKRRDWRRVDGEGQAQVQQASLLWQRRTWRQPRRVVAIRKRDTDEPQGHLFDIFGWSYTFYVTNLDWPAEEIARFYDKRADMERTICEAKHDLAIGQVPTSSFAANAADLALKILARNLLVLYRDRGLRLGMRCRIRTLRRRFLYVVGRLVRRGGRWLLRLARGSPLDRLLAAHPVPG